MYTSTRHHQCLDCPAPTGRQSESYCDLSKYLSTQIVCDCLESAIYCTKENKRLRLVGHGLREGLSTWVRRSTVRNEASSHFWLHGSWITHQNWRMLYMHIKSTMVCSKRSQACTVPPSSPPITGTSGAVATKVSTTCISLVTN